MLTARKLISLGYVKIYRVYSVVAQPLRPIILKGKTWGTALAVKAAIRLSFLLIDLAIVLSKTTQRPTETMKNAGWQEPCPPPLDKDSSKKWDELWDDPELKGPDKKRWLPEYYEKDL